MDKVTTLQFVERARKKHGGKYDYSRVVVDGMNNKVVIGCPTHGYFRQTPSHHLKGGCRHCGQVEARRTQKRTIGSDPNYRNRDKRHTTFVSQAKKTHGARYDYSKVIFVNVDTKVEIVCRKHGSFFVTPYNHLKSGCPRCADETRSERSGTKDERLRAFVLKARKAHGRRYDYSQVKYVNARKPVVIICRKHGAFLQTPWSHGEGHGCRRCGHGGNPQERRAKSVSTFLLAARARHGERFAYEQVTQENIYGRVPIGCPVHGTILLTREQHLEKGCLDCLRDETCVSKKTEFLAKAKKKHGNRFDYSQMTFVDMTTKVKIICQTHGEFYQEPWRHLDSVAGCTKCGWQSTGQSLSLTPDAFLAKATGLFGNEYDFSRVVYKNNRTKIAVGCRKHGQFEITPDKLLAGSGCQACAIESRREKNRLTLDEFAAKAKIVHGNRYDYSETSFDSESGKWLVKCRQHGPWLVSSSNHLSRGSGCPKCPVSMGHEFIRAVLIEFALTFEEEKRFKTLPGYRYDFFVADRKLLIEYDGIQHFQAVDLFGGEQALSKTQQRDRRKDRWAKANGYRLIRIRFDMPDDEIRTRISSAVSVVAASTATPRHPLRVLKRHRSSK